MQLSFDAADRLVELVQVRGALPASQAARSLFALASAPTAIARSLLDEVVSGDARLAWRGITLAPTEQKQQRNKGERAAHTVTFAVSITLRI